MQLFQASSLSGILYGSYLLYLPEDIPYLRSLWYGWGLSARLRYWKNLLHNLQSLWVLLRRTHLRLRPEHFFHISRIDSLISKEGTSVDIFDCITKCKELIPGLRNFQIIFVEECLIVDQALWTAVERCKIDIAISIWCTLAACKDPSVISSRSVPVPA